MVFMVYNKLFQKLLEEIEQIERNTLPKHIIRALFHMSSIGNAINKDKIL